MGALCAKGLRNKYPLQGSALARFLGAAVDRILFTSDRLIKLHFSAAFDRIGIDLLNKCKLHQIRAEACAHLAQEGFVPFGRIMVIRPIAHSVSEDQQHQKANGHEQQDVVLKGIFGDGVNEKLQMLHFANPLPRRVASAAENGSARVFKGFRDAVGS